MGCSIRRVNINDFDKGWLVGLIEGEGCFVLSEDKRRPGTYTVKIQVESTDHDVIFRLEKLLNGNVIESNYPSKFKAFPNAKDSWRWTVSTKKQVAHVISLVYEHLSIRRKQQADRLIPYLVYKRKQNV